MPVGESPLIRAAPQFPKDKEMYHVGEVTALVIAITVRYGITVNLSFVTIRLGWVTYIALS